MNNNQILNNNKKTKKPQNNTNRYNNGTIVVQKKGKKKIKGNKKRGGNQLRAPKGFYMSQCAHDYLKALTDPFNFRLSGTTACIPDLLDEPSYKFNTTVRGFTTVGTQGVGFILISPFTFSNDQVFGLTSNSTYAQLGFPTGPYIPAPNISEIRNSQFPYDNAGYRLTRLVSLGIRVRYVGTELNRSGVICPVTTLASNDTLNAITLTSALGRPQVQSYSIDTDRRWYGCMYAPLQTVAYQYQDTSLDGTQSGNWKMGILFTGLQGTPVTSPTFQFEITSFYETVPRGTLNTPSTTASHSDISGMSRIRDFLGTISSSEVGQTVYAKAVEYLSSTANVLATSYISGKVQPTLMWR